MGKNSIIVGFGRTNSVWSRLNNLSKDMKTVAGHNGLIQSFPLRQCTDKEFGTFADELTMGAAVENDIKLQLTSKTNQKCDSCMSHH